MEFEVLGTSNTENFTNFTWVVDFKTAKGERGFPDGAMIREKGGGYFHPKLGYECRQVCGRIFIRRRAVPCRAVPCRAV